MADRQPLRHHQMMLNDGAPPSILRWPGDSPQPLPMVSATPEIATPRFADDAELRRAADREWREWIPTRESRTRPQLRSILRRMRNEQKEKEKAMAKPGAKELHSRALGLQRAAIKNSTTIPARQATTTPPATPAAKQENATMAKKTATKKKTSAKKAAAPKKSKAAKAPKAEKSAKTDGTIRPGSKLEIVATLLRQPGGTTTKEILAKTGWPTVSVPQQAKAAGITLHKEKVDGVTRYSEAKKADCLIDAARSPGEISPGLSFVCSPAY